MVNRESALRISLAIGLWVLLVVVFAVVLSAFGAIRGEPLVVAAVALAVGLLLSKVTDTLFDFAFKREPTIGIEPLTSAWGRSEAIEAQWVNMVWTPGSTAGGPAQQAQVTALFGVIKVTAHHGKVLGCRASLRYRAGYPQHDARTGLNSVVERWQPGGNLSWYSASVRKNLTRLDSVDLFDLGAPLRNPLEDLDPGSPRELLLCYLPHGWKTPVICSDMPREVIPLSPGEPRGVDFLAEITFSATNLKTVTKLFKVSVRADEIIVTNHAGPAPPDSLGNH